jgi:N,N'-diacetyllegionaminate synthase
MNQFKETFRSSTEDYLIVAEAGLNHNGDLNLAFQMIDAAKNAGAHAIKFQTFKASEFCGDPDQLFTYKSQGVEITESMLEMFQRYELKAENWLEIKKYCDKREIVFFSTPQNISDLELLLPLKIPFIKIGSDDLTNIPLIENFATHGIPLILSSGMSDAEKIEEALSAAGYYSAKPVALLVCTSLYPTEPGETNLLRLSTLRQKYPDLCIGFSDHTQGSVAAVASIGLGATIFEKHFTLDKSLPGPDHWFSPDPVELKSWVESIKNGFLSLGSGVLEPANRELEMIKMARRSVLTLSSIAKGEELTLQNVGLRRPGGGMTPTQFKGILGKFAARDLPASHLINFGDFDESY